jgi:hypothetical protein
MYQSLLKHDNNFYLWIICFDDLAYELLHELKLSNVSLVSLTQFEDSELLAIKSKRTRQEYCWTCTPSTILYVLNNAPYVDAVTYLDADLMFFSSPEPIFTEAGQASIILTEHRYMPEFDNSLLYGIYNVQFMMFRRDKEGLKAINWWRDRCLEWCYLRLEDGKFGDQKYLDDWLDRFQGVHVLQNIGAGLAPWNATQYSIHQLDNIIYVNDVPVIFYHFHYLKLYPFNISHLSSYPINIDIINFIYVNYLQEINKAYQEISSIYPNFKGGITNFPNPPKRPDKLYRCIVNTIQDIQTGKYRKYA